MPRGFGDGKPPRELEDDPIDDEEQPRRTSITSTRPPVNNISLGQRGAKEERYLPYATTGHVDEQDIIGPPFSDRRNTMSGTAVLSGYHRPRNTLHGSSNTSRKRQQTSIQEVEQLQAEQAKKRCVSGFEPASTFSDEEKRPARTKQRTGMGAGIGRSKQAQAAAQAKKSVHLDPSSDDDDQYRQLQLPPRFKKEENQKRYDDNVSSALKYVSTKTSTRRNAQKGKLVSRKLTGWKLSTFQFGTDQVDSSKDGALELVITNKAIKVMRDGNEWPVEWNKLLQLKVGPSSFALIFEGNRENRFGYFALARSSDMSAVTEALGKLLPEAISYVDEGAIRKHYNNIMVWQEKRDLALPLVDDPSDAKQQQENNDRQCAEMLNGEMRKEGLHRMTRSNKPVLQVEIPSLSPRRPQLSKPVIMETTKRTLARPVSLEDSDDHKDKETVPTLQPKPLPPRWSNPLLYPFTGPKQTNVDWEDLKRLRPEEFLNDNIINFYMRYLEVNLQEKNPALAEQTHFFNTFLFERLSRKGDRAQNIQSVMKWTAKIDLFQKNYIIVPINEQSHWYLAIICNLQHLERKLDTDTAAHDSDTTMVEDRSTDKIDPPPLGDKSSAVDAEAPSGRVETSEPELAEARNHLESMCVDEEGQQNDWPSEDEVERLDKDQELRNRRMLDHDHLTDKPTSSSNTDEDDPKATKKAKAARRSSHYAPPNTPAIIILDSMGASRKGAVQRLKEWLVVEASKKRGLQITKDDLKGNHAKVPGQNNWYDCGLFVLHYIEVFLNHADTFVESLLARDNALKDDVWREEEIAGKRIMLMDLICSLHDQYEAIKPTKTVANPKPKSKPEPVGGNAAPSTDPSATEEEDSSESEENSHAGQIITEAQNLPSQIQPSAEAAMAAMREASSVSKHMEVDSEEEQQVSETKTADGDGEVEDTVVLKQPTPPLPAPSKHQKSPSKRKSPTRPRHSSPIAKRLKEDDDDGNWTPSGHQLSRAASIEL